MLRIEQYAYSSKLKSTDPMEKIVLSFLTLSVCLGANAIAISILVSLIMAFFTVRLGGIPLFQYLKLLFVPTTFILVGMVAISIQITGQPQSLWSTVQIGSMYLGVSKAGAITAAHLFFRAFGAVSCLYYLALNTPLVDILTALRKLKIPPLLVEMMNLTYRFIFVLIETTAIMMTAQDSRLGYSSMSSGYHSLAALMASVFVRSYQQADKIYTALECRGYHGEINVLAEHKEKKSKNYIHAVALNIILVAIAYIVES